MFTRLLDSVLPGLRDARTPLASGLLWLLFAWILLAQSIPTPVNATGFVKQLYDVARTIADGYTLAAVALLAYIVGILGATAGDAIRNPVAWAWRRGIVPVQEWVRWQSIARRKRRGLKKEIRVEQSQLRTAAGSPTEAQLKGALEQHSGQLSKIREAEVLWGAWTLRTPDTLGLLGRRSQSARQEVWTVAEGALSDAWQKGVDDELQRRNADIASNKFSDQSLNYYDRLVDHDLGPEPLDALRALDDGLYQAFDRERAEREFRIAVMPPTIAFAVYVGHTMSQWGYALAALALFTFVRAAIGHSQETTRVLNQIIVKRLSLPSLAGAERAARVAVRDYLASENARGQIRGD